MKIETIGSCAKKVSAGIALSSLAFAAQADPISLQGVCHLTSIVAGQGKCQLEYLLTDSLVGGTPASVRKAQVKINNILVAQYVNDTANPVDYSGGTVSGVTEVACGGSYQITGFIARVGPATTYEKLGVIPPVVCPSAP